MQKWRALEKGPWRYAYIKKAVFFLPVNILTVWSPAFFVTRHTTVCLDTWQMYPQNSFDLIYIHTKTAKL